MAGLLTMIVGVPEDVRGQSLLDRWDIHPKYTTGYNVNRTRQTWSQGLSLNRNIGALRLNNRLSLKQVKNSAQNDSEEQRASYKMSLDTELREWTVGLDLNLRRDRSDNNFSRRRDHDTNVDLRLEKTLDLPLPLLGPVQFTGTGGYSLESDLSERGQGLQGVRRDSTRASGTTWGLDLGTNGDLVKNVNYTGRLSFSGANQTSETFSFVGGEEDRQKDPNDDFRRDTRFQVTWDPESEWKGTFGANFGFNERENFDFEVQEKETRIATSQRIDASLEGPIRPRVKLRADLNRSISDIKFDLKEQDSFKRTDKFGTELKYEPDVFLLKGFVLRTEFDVTKTRTEPEASRNYDLEERKIRFVAEKALGVGLRVTGTSELNLRQELYDDASLDKDEFRTAWDGSLTYSPNKRFSARLSFLRTDTEIINIPAEKAANNNTVQRNRISANYSYDFSFPVKVTQMFNISADYTFFTFDETSNTLRRTNEVRTKIEGGFGSAVKLNLEHTYKFGDSGSFRQENGGRLLYNPSSETLRQYLVLETRYQLYRVITLNAKQSYDARTTTTLSTGRKRTTERVEFSGGVDFRHQFSRGFSVEGSFRQTQSNLEDDFWVVEASLTRDF